jgi:hypothetical protein
MLKHHFNYFVLRRYMNRFFIVLFLIAISASGSSVYATGSGRTGRTLKSSSAGCGSCHGSSATSGVVVHINGPDTVMVSDTARYTLTITGGPGIVGGCNIARRSTGTLIPITNLKLSSSELTQPSPVSFSGSTVTFTFDYVATSTAMLDTLFAVGLSANGSGSSGDQWNWSPSKRVTVIDPPVPIQLAMFLASVTQDNDVQLEWSTVSEINNYGFFIERRNEGEASFTELPNSFRPGAGTTLEPRQYAWTDDAPAAGTYYYRLRQVDLNGDQSWSYEIVVTVTGVLSVSHEAWNPSEFSLHGNFPNPFNPSTAISFDLPHASYVSLNVFDVEGKLVAELIEGERPAGQLSVTWNAVDVPSGVYFCRLEARNLSNASGRFLGTKKMLLLK